MPVLYDKSNDRLLGHISQADLEVLIAQLEEESSHDRDYYRLNAVQCVAHMGQAPEADISPGERERQQEGGQDKAGSRCQQARRTSEAKSYKDREFRRAGAGNQVRRSK